MIPHLSNGEFALLAVMLAFGWFIGLPWLDFVLRERRKRMTIDRTNGEPLSPEAYWRAVAEARDAGAQASTVDALGNIITGLDWGWGVQNVRWSDDYGADDDDPVGAGTMIQAHVYAFNEEGEPILESYSDGFGADSYQALRRAFDSVMNQPELDWLIQEHAKEA